MATEPGAGLAGVIAGHTAIATVGKEGKGLTYRGYSIHGGTGSPGENLRRTQGAMGFGCGTHASLCSELGLAADLGLGA